MATASVALKLALPVRLQSHCTLGHALLNGDSNVDRSRVRPNRRYRLSSATGIALRQNPVLPPEVGDCEKACYSGDLVKIDQEVFLHFVGCRHTLIKSSGVRISPTEFEAILFKTGRLF